MYKAQWLHSWRQLCLLETIENIPDIENTLREIERRTTTLNYIAETYRSSNQSHAYTDGSAQTNYRKRRWRNSTESKQNGAIKAVATRKCS